MSEDLFAEAKEKIKEKIAAAKSDSTDEIVCIIDRSGSMWSIKDDAAGSLNAFISEQCAVGEANLTIVEFDNTINTVCDRVDINEAKEYKLEPGGSTALLDAIGTVVANNLKYNAPDGKTVVVIITDGGENASKEWSRDDVFSMINERKEEGWEFLFLASNQDAISTGMNYGFDMDQTVSFADDAGGIQAANAVASLYTSTTRAYSKGEAMSMKKQYVDMNIDNLSDTGEVKKK